jgi:hypothetical protein
MVSLDDRVRLESASSVMSSSATSVVVTPSHNLLGHHGGTLLSTSSHHLHSHLSHHSHHLAGSSQQQQQQHQQEAMDDGQPDTPIDEPQDLTPTQVLAKFKSLSFMDCDLDLASNCDQISFIYIKGPVIYGYFYSTYIFYLNLFLQLVSSTPRLPYNKNSVSLS